MRRSRARGLGGAGLVVAAGALLASGALPTAAAVAAAKSSSTAVLTIGTPYATATDNFNPYSATTTVSSAGINSLIYEPLLQFNVVKPAVHDWLASSYTWSDAGKKITFTIRKGVRFSDGQPLTSSDVAFTYEMIKKNPALNITGISLTNVSSSGDTVTLTLPMPGYQELQSLASVYIVPKSVWSTIANPTVFTNPNPVGSGPFVLSSYTPQGIVLKPNTAYWQGAPKVSEIEVLFESSDTTLEEALQSGAVQWATDFIPDVQKLYLAKSSNFHFWGPPLYAIALIPNLKVWPTNQLAVRQAISLSVNRAAWVNKAETGQGQALTNPSGLPAPFDGFIASSLQSQTIPFSIAQARATLKKAGFSLGPNGYFEKGGKTVSLTLALPSPFADWVEAAQLMVQSMKKAGIDATFQGTSPAAWRADLASGNFQLMPDFATTSLGITPYEEYLHLLDSSLTAPIGKAASGDYERLFSPSIDKDLAAFASAGNHAQEMAALTPVERYLATQLPVIPTIAEDGFDEYSTQSFVGWPSASNPYEVGIVAAPYNEVVILHLRPKS